MSLYEVQRAIRAGDINGLRTFCETSTEDPPLHLEHFIEREWWDQVRERLQLNRLPQGRIRSEADLVDLMARMSKADLAKRGWVKQLDDLEKTFVRMLKILKEHHYLPPTQSPYYVVDMIACNNYGLAKEYIDLYVPETCELIGLAYHRLNASMQEKHASVRYNEHKARAVLDLFAEKCKKSVEKGCTVQDFDIDLRTFHPLLEASIGKYFQNPHLLEERIEPIRLAGAIDAHHQGKRRGNHAEQHLTDPYMLREILSFMPRSHETPQKSPNKKRQKTVRGGRVRVHTKRKRTRTFSQKSV